MTCAQVSELLAAYADGGLEGREHDEVAEHVRGCTACAEEVRHIRDLLGDARQLAAGPAEEERGEIFWHSLGRDINAAVAAAQPKVPWWRLPAVTSAFAMAAAAVIWMQSRPSPKPRQLGRPPAEALGTLGELERDEPPEVTELADNIDAARAMLASADLEAERQAGPPTDDELAAANPAAAETLIESLDEDELARVHAAL